MTLLYLLIVALVVCDLVEMDWQNVSPRERAIELVLCAMIVFASGWGIAFDLFA